MKKKYEDEGNASEDEDFFKYISMKSKRMYGD